MEMEARFGARRPIVGMVHLPPLPGAPRYDPDSGRAALHEAARRDAERLAAGGVDAVLVENFGDAPYYPEEVPTTTVADLTALVRTVRNVVDIPVGVNVLRNDATAAVAVAAATGATFVRVNVHVGVRVTDQGTLAGRAHETMRLRAEADADVGLLADVDVKHSAPLAAGSYEAESVAESTERGLADGVVVTGARTGRATPLERVETAVERRNTLGIETPVFVGSGVDAGTVGELLGVADGLIVGTALKQGGETTAPVSVGRVEELVAAADQAR
jgi:membrane complex biogenesis BtpA family protein